MIVNAALSKHFSNPTSVVIAAQGRMGRGRPNRSRPSDGDQK
jgi:hypothetical protein